ncbi:outer membrane protein transport protein [uncultured Roseobacter sp.]|uniref:outer membrane protein transport protein n=1 Tax=uncultured Roseobacter sp. TaxID=114847 RepID=UPI002608E367|nr:outer membrane protein transport protein [uncultured Roseobacter sp.]
MRVSITSVTALCLAAGGASAGGIDRSGQSIGVLFEEGRYLELNAVSVTPELTGDARAPFASGSGSGDVAPSYFRWGAAYKADINDKLSYAIILDEPFGADVEYPGGTGYFASTSNAEFDSRALTGLLRYKLNSGFSVYGGLRIQSVEANADVNFVRPVGPPLFYSANADVHYGVGYVAGLAYEKPEIALRVSLTYSSEISHSVDTNETVLGFGSLSTSTEFETPQSVNLEFQTGVAADTLLFGGIRWVDWSDFALDPSLYQTVTGGSNLLSYEEDVVTYTLGVGRRLNDNWSVAASLGYEENTGNLFTNLGPADGQESLSLAAIYSEGNYEITTGIRYIRIGDTTTGVSGTPAANFNDNDAIAIGVKIGFRF